MKRILFCLAATMAIAATAQAADINTAKGTKQLVFQFNGLSDLSAGAYNGGFGTRYYLNDGLALRPGVQLFSSSSTEKSLTPNVSDNKYTTNGFGLSLALESHRKGPANISPFCGAGFEWSMYSATHEPSHLPNATATMTKQVNTGNAFGLFGVTGFEWGFTQSMTLGAEYRLGFNYDSGKTKTTMDGKETTTADDSGWNFGLSAASVYLSVGI